MKCIHSSTSCFYTYLFFFNTLSLSLFLFPFLFPFFSRWDKTKKKWNKTRWSVSVPLFCEACGGKRPGGGGGREGGKRVVRCGVVCGMRRWLLGIACDDDKSPRLSSFTDLSCLLSLNSLYQLSVCLSVCLFFFCTYKCLVCSLCSFLCSWFNRRPPPPPHLTFDCFFMHSAGSFVFVHTSGSSVFIHWVGLSIFISCKVVRWTCLLLVLRRTQRGKNEPKKEWMKEKEKEDYSCLYLWSCVTA